MFSAKALWKHTKESDFMVDRAIESRRQQLRRSLVAKAISFYRKYPDKFCEEILEIKLNLYQKILMRAFFRSKYSLWIMSRGLGKTWEGALCLCIFAMLYRNTSIGVVAPSFRQGKILIEDKIIKDLMDRSDFLRGEFSRLVLNMAEGRVEFFNGSRIIAIPIGDDGAKVRGFRFNVIMADRQICLHI